MEKELWQVNGFGCILVFLGIWALTLVFGVTHSWLAIPFGILSLLLFLTSSGFFILQPNEAKVVTFFGTYIGTARIPGFFFTMPFTMKNNVSLKVVNNHTEKTKVNDSKGNPIEIGAVIVWRVANPFKAFFGVYNYPEFVSTQAEAAIRSIAMHYPYDAHDDHIESLRSHPDAIMEVLEKMLQERLDVAGVRVLEARISDLSYAPEIAQSMLRRQQAEAQIAARKYIVENTVTIVEEVLARLESGSSLVLDGAQKVQIVNNLLIALVSEGDTTPVINIGQR